MTDYYQIDKSGLVFKNEDGICSFLSKEGEWIRYQPLFGKLVGGDSDYEKITQEQVEAIIYSIKQDGPNHDG